VVRKVRERCPPLAHPLLTRSAKRRHQGNTHRARKRSREVAGRCHGR
jgi:hypothetical protein